MATQLKDWQGNNVTPIAEGGGGGDTMPASKVTLANGTGLSATNVQSGMKELNDKINSSSGGGSSHDYDMADGNMDESCLQSASPYIASKTVVGGKPVIDSNDNIVVIAHDDMAESDYVGTRLIYNKYNFKGTFNYILAPFANKTDKNKRISNTKKMITDGNEFGLHAVFATSYFWRNLLYDVTPNGNVSFAPTLAEMKTVVSNNKNIFGIVIDASSTFTTVKHGDNRSVASVLLNSATQDQWFAAVSHYTVYANTLTSTGLDLTDTVATKLNLEWLEYWYNELIDNTLGYSTYVGTIAERFAADYEGVYPDAAHILSGDLSGYGTFTKGLFKGCHSCCNYEVVDRIISIAEAVCRYYFGLVRFTNMAYHGQHYADLWWKGSDGALYHNRDCTVIATGYSKLFLSLQNRWKNIYDIALSHGIKMTKRQFPNDDTRLEGQIGLYYGQKDIRGCYFNDLSPYNHNGYLALLGTSSNSPGMTDNISYETLMQTMPSDYSLWAKYAYEHAGEDVSGNGTLYMLPYFKQAIDAVRRAQGTGKVPYMGLDTISKKATVYAAIEMVLQYCYKHNIRVVPSFEAMTLCNNKRFLDRIFPNPTFKQTLLDDFGGSSTSEDAYIPDGFILVDGDGKCRVTEENGNKVLTISDGSSATTIQARIYGLPAGSYKFTAMVKTSNASTCIAIGKKTNGMRALGDSDILESITANSNYEQVTYTIVIPEPIQKSLDGTRINTICGGREDNIAYVSVDFIAEVGKYTSLYNPKIEVV